MSHPSIRAQQLLKASQHADETLDAVAFASLFVQEGTFTMGANRPAVGRSAIEAAVAAFFTMLSGMHHEMLHTWEDDELFAYQAEVTWTLKDGATVTTPYVNVIRFSGDRVASYQIHIDPSELLRRTAS